MRDAFNRLLYENPFGPLVIGLWSGVMALPFIILLAVYLS